MIELTEYELDRGPQEIRIDQEIAVNSTLLHRELMCPICLDILNKTMTTRECLHRFCSACINRALRNGNKECPTCRKKLTSRRCLRPDPNFDLIISKLYHRGHDKVEEHTVNIAPDCEIILRPLNGHEARYIKCPSTATIGHICQYLAIRPNMYKSPELSSHKYYQICIVADRNEGQYQLVRLDLNMDQVREEYKLDIERPLELYFHDPNEDDQKWMLP